MSDRFLLKIQIGYPSLADEVRMVEAISTGRARADFDLSKLKPLIGPEEVVAMQQSVATVRVDAAVLDYAVRLVHASREWPGISMGAGPRGSLALVRLARAKAAMDGRDFVVPDDVRDVLLPALRHRIALSPELQLEGQSPDAVLSAMADRVKAPQR
jgi:MoxR-like ATPase